jgi:glycerophosphoryl diester phosphodiesterase
MRESIGPIFRRAGTDLKRLWRSLAITDLAYKAIAFAALTPAVTLLLYWLRAGASERVIADVEIPLFFLTTPAGIVSLILGASLIVAISALETACLMAIGFGGVNGQSLTARSALRFGAVHAPNVLRLSGHMVLRLIAGAIPFLLAGGLTYLALLRAHDINYYLARRPPEFWIAGAIVVLIVVGIIAAVVRTVARWALAMPLLLFEKVHPRHALAGSAKRTSGSHSLVIATLAVWAIISIALIAATSWFVNFVGLTIAPRLAGSLTLLLLFVAVLAIGGVVLALAVGIVNASLFALLITRLYLSVGKAKPGPAIMTPYLVSETKRLSGRAVTTIRAVGVLAAVGVSLAAFLVNRNQSPVLIIAHRGSSLTAPENTLAAFRLAADQKTDFIELDVQESSDGQVLVAHDSDLMKVARNATKIWEGDAATLRAIDIGSYKDARFAAERVPTLAEALAICKGRCRVVVELKSYGHNQQLEQRVVDVVEAAGMQNDCVFMSLDHTMARKLKELRPDWRVGLLVAKSIGDLTELKADFLAVEARMATRRFIRQAHGAGQDVYVWTVNDPAWMFVALSRGVDGLITDKPDEARRVVELRAQMSNPQRFLTAQLIRLGASTEALEAENALRP